MNPRVTHASAKENYILDLQFSNGEKKYYDCAPLLDFGIFQELKNPEYFKKVSIQYDTVSWPNEQDICPDTLYLESQEIQ